MTCFKGRRPTVSRSPSESAPRGSNPPVRRGRPVPRRSARGTDASKAEGGGVEPPRLIARPISSRVPSPIGLPFRAFQLRRQESNLRPPVNSRAPVPARAPPESVRVGAAGFEPALSWSRTRRIARLSHTPSRSSQVPSGSRTRTSAMARRQAAATSWARVPTPNCQRVESTGWDSNPRRRITGAVSSPLDDQCLVSSGTRGIRTLTDPVKSRACCR